MEHGDDTIKRARRESEDAIEGGWGKFFVRVTGRITAIIVVILLVAAAPTYSMYLHDLKADKTSAEVNKMFAEIKDALKDSNDIAQAQVYLMTISEEERKRLNLTRPRKIMEMQR